MQKIFYSTIQFGSFLKKVKKLIFSQNHDFHDFGRHLSLGSAWILNYKPSKIIDFSNMTRLLEVIKFFLERVEKKNAPSLRIYAPRSFDWRYFQLHQSTPSLSKMPLNIRNFGNFRIWRPEPPYIHDCVLEDSRPSGSGLLNNEPIQLSAPDLVTQFYGVLRTDSRGEPSQLNTRCARAFGKD